MQEIWKSIDNYIGLYEISNLGRVKSLDRIVKHHSDHIKFIHGKLRVLKTDKNKYMSVILSKNGINKRVKIHRLVAIAFIHNPDNKPEVNHKNGIKSDNTLENLEWMTKSENKLHSFRVLKIKPTWKGKFGNEHPNSKQIIQYTKSGEFINEYSCSNEAERITNVSRQNIGSCCRGKLKSAGGYIWKFKIKK